MDFPPFTQTEISSALQSFKRGKTSGPDQVPPWILGHLPSAAVQTFLTNYCNLLTRYPLHTDDQRVWIRLLHKMGDPGLLPNYRPISLSTAIYLIQARLLLKRLQTQVDQLGLLHPSQGAGGKGRGSTLQQITGLLAQALGLNTPYFLSIDLQKAFDSVCRETLWKMLRQRGIHPELVRCIELLYDNPTLATLIGPHSDWIPFGSKGLKQGCPLSPLLFALFLDPLLRKLATLTNNLTRLKKAPTAVPAYGWLDDLGLLLDKNQLQTALDIIQQFVTNFCMAVNASKTVILNLNSNSTPWFTFCNQAVQALPKHSVTKCLGVYISGSREAIQSKLENDLGQDLNQLSMYDFDPAARALIVSRKLVPRYAYRLTLFASANNCIKTLQTRMTQWIRDGGTKKLHSASEETIFTCRPQGGLGVHRLHVRVCMQLVCLMYKTLQDYPLHHPLHSTKQLLTALVQTPDTSDLNIIHSYKTILKQCSIQSPMLGQPLITHHFQSTNTVPTMHAPTGWLTTMLPKPPNLQHPNNLPPAVIQTLQQAQDFNGEVVYVDGSAKDGHAGSSFYYPRTGLSGKQRVTGMQTSGRGEVNAIIGAIRFRTPHLPLLILSDCYGVIRRCNTMSHLRLDEAPSTKCRWKNRDLWHTLHELWTSNIQIEWIPGHKNITANERADTLANEARRLPIHQCTWQKELWRLYYKGAEVGTELIHHLLDYIPSTRPTHTGRQRTQLTWDGINIHLSFCNLGDRGHITRFQWLWGRTH
jgi:ribonuclease HI